MKTQNTINAFVLGMSLIASTPCQAQAQTTNSPTITDEIMKGSDQADSLVKNLQNAQDENYNGSVSYQEEGPKLNAILIKAARDYQSALNSMFVKDIRTAQEGYNRAYAKPPSEQRTKDLTRFWSLLNSRAKSLTGIYQSEIKHLFQVLPEFTASYLIVRRPLMSLKGYVKLGFLDGSEQTIFEGEDLGDYKVGIENIGKYFINSSSENTYESRIQQFHNNWPYGNLTTEGLKKPYASQFTYYLSSKCRDKSRRCVNGLVNQISSYFEYVQSYLNTERKIDVASGDHVVIRPLEGSAPIDILVDTITNYQFDPIFNSYTMDGK